MSRIGVAICGIAALVVGASLLSFQVPPRTATFAEVLKGFVGRECQPADGGPGVQLLVFPPPPIQPGGPKGFKWPKLSMVGDDFVRLTDYKGRESWLHMSRISVQTKAK